MTDIALVAFDQFGGNRAMVMLGGRASITREGDLIVSFKMCKKASLMRIRYDKGSDTYVMAFGRYTGHEVVYSDTISGLYAEDLRDCFESYTGLRTAL